MERGFCDIIVGLEIRWAGGRREYVEGGVGADEAEERANRKQSGSGGFVQIKTEGERVSTMGAHERCRRLMDAGLGTAIGDREVVDNLDVVSNYLEISREGVSCGVGSGSPRLFVRAEAWNKLGKFEGEAWCCVGICW